MSIEAVSAAIDTRDAHLLLLLGFDGVLLDYHADPQAVRLSPDRCAALSALADQPDVHLGIVSGRRISDLRRCATLGERIFHVGLHGLEIEGPAFGRLERVRLATYRDRVREIVTTLELSMSSVKGVRVEDKEAAVAVHTREAGPRDAVWARMHLLSTASRMVQSQEFRVIRANHVMELMPNVLDSRATAIAAVRRHLEALEGPPVLTVYIGEDVPDDDAWAATNGCGLSVAVGARAPKAQFHLTSPADVWRLIDRIRRGRNAAVPDGGSGSSRARSS
jgi:trehalose-phosphatase